MKVYWYEIDDGGKGIVMATCAIDAMCKVRKAYSLHGGISESNTIRVTEFKADFNDAPDVMELIDY